MFQGLESPFFRHGEYVKTMGTKKNPNEIKVSTVLYRSNEKTRILVEGTDYCYVLPTDGNLRFGTEKKFFERKK